MADYVFTSPGVKFKERDITYVTRNVGVTTLGLVGETLKGPAFEPVFIDNQNNLTDRFGAQNTKRLPNGNLQYQLPYVGNAFLEQAQQLWVTRVLGLSGYQAGASWNILLEAGVDTGTTVTGTPTTFTSGFTGNVFMNVALSGDGDTGSYDSGWEKDVSTGIFTDTVMTFEVSSYTAETKSGIVTGETTVLTATGLTEYDNMVLAVIRSRGDSDTSITTNLQHTTFNTARLAISGNTTVDSVLSPNGNIFAEFTLTASNAGIDPTDSEPTGSTKSYVASLSPNDSGYLPNVIGSKPRGMATKIWVEAIYPDLIKKLYDEGIAYGIKTQMITGGTEQGFGVFNDYKTTYQTPETPWVVSQLKGNGIDRLFKFISISDGSSANEEIKISISDINPYTLEFNVTVRKFSDTDANPTILDTFTNCTMIKGTSSYIGKKIGTSDGEYSLKSDNIMVEIADETPLDVFPAGFEGFMFNNYASSVTDDDVTEGIAPAIFYKTSYSDSEKRKLNTAFLGVSELGYTGDGINQNMFNFNNWGHSGMEDADFSQSKGFHMDSGATSANVDGTTKYFEVGDGKFRTYADSDDTENPYYNEKSRKFTVVPAGGFDGWDVNRRSRSYGDTYIQGGRQSGVESALDVPTNDFQAWEMAIDTFANPENVSINLFATPGINWADQTVLVENTIDMIENQRTDSLYIIDSPELAGEISTTVGGSGKEDVSKSEEIVSYLSDTGIDSSYACTYFPWILMNDFVNGVNVYLPPTGEVVKAMAYTDNVKFPWFAPAGLNRGVTDAKQSMYKLSLEARDNLYSGRINPLADFAESGTAIFGQKTLQVKESALDRINVRRLLLQIKVLISNIAVRLLFEQNDQSTIDSFLTQVNPILDSIKRERGLTDFRVKMDNTNNTSETRDRNELYGEIFLKPTRAVEFIGITFTVTPSGASFADVGA